MTPDYAAVRGAAMRKKRDAAEVRGDGYLARMYDREAQVCLGVITGRVGADQWAICSFEAELKRQRNSLGEPGDRGPRD